MKLTVLAICTIFAYGCYAQDHPEQSRISTSTTVSSISNQEIPTHEQAVQNYKLDYELVNYSFPAGDSSILELLNVEQMYSRRQESEDIELIDLQNGFTVLMYSRQKSIEKREQLTKE